MTARIVTLLVWTFAAIAGARNHVGAQCKPNEVHLGDYSFTVGYVEVKLTVCYDSEGQKLTKHGYINNVKVDTQESAVRHLYGDVYHYSEEQIFKLEGEKGAGWRAEYALDIRKPALVGHRVLVGIRTDLFRGRLRWKEISSSNWPEALKELGKAEGNAIVLRTLARGPFRKYYLDVGNGVAELNAAEKRGTHWRLVRDKDFFRLVNVGHPEHWG